MTEDTDKNTSYRIMHEIGEGGMGIVYLAEDARTRKEVAIKCIRREHKEDAEYLKRFCRETQIVSNLENPNIIRIITFDLESEVPWFVMEFCKVGSLEVLANNIEAKEVIELFIQACQGIAYAHSQGVLHRDVKPSNMLVGNDGLVKIADFGLAVSLNRYTPTLTISGQSLGTVAFMSPEQIANAKQVTEASDIYSLGATLYYLLTGEIPGTLVVRPALLSEGLNKGEEDAVFELIYQCLERNPAKRPNSVKELAASLGQIVGVKSKTDKPPPVFDADDALCKILKFKNDVSDYELKILRRIKEGDLTAAMHQLSERYGLYESDEYTGLWSLYHKGLVNFREEDRSSGKYVRNFYMVDIAITSLGLALMRYLD